jgi:hypothetical protein
MHSKYLIMIYYRISYFKSSLIKPKNILKIGTFFKKLITEIENIFVKKKRKFIVVFTKNGLIFWISIFGKNFVQFIRWKLLNSIIMIVNLLIN